MKDVGVGGTVIHALSSLPRQAWWLVAILAGLSLVSGGGRKKKKRKKKSKEESNGFVALVIMGAVLLAAGGTGGALKVPIVHHAVTDAIHSGGPANERLANAMAAAKGWGSSEQGCLDSLWNRETGGTWDTHITDPIVVSGHLAYGIPQAVGHDPGGGSAVVTYEKFLNGSVTQGVSVDDYPTRAGNAGDARSQISWGLGYIQSAYGTPCHAWGYEVTHNGY